jgi:hypothetical protein
MNTSRIRWAALLPLLAMGCADELPPGAKVDTLRVLAQQADQPFAHPGETVQLRSLSYDPRGRTLNWAWASCVNPSESTLIGCIDRIAQSPDPASAVFAMGEGTDAPSISIPNDALSSLPAQARAAAGIGVVSAACPGDLSLGEGPAGLPFKCQERGTGRELPLDDFIVGIKRISLRETERNQNPQIARITFDGEEWAEGDVKEVGSCDRSDFDYASCPDAQKHQLEARLTQDSFEAGRDELGRDFEEQLVVQYYATEGIFENEVKIGSEPKNGWVARKSAAGQTLELWFVARDNRGGVAWAQRQVKVR